jgi:hypothetical protein
MLVSLGSAHLAEIDARCAGMRRASARRGILVGAQG